MTWINFDKIQKKDKNKVLDDFWSALSKSFDKKILNTYFFFDNNYNFNSKTQLTISVSMNISIKDIIKSGSDLKELEKLSKTNDIVIDKYSKKIKFRVTGGNRGNGILKYVGEVSKQPSNDQQEIATIYAIQHKLCDLICINKKIGFEFDDFWGYHFSESRKLSDYKINNKKIIRTGTKILHDATNVNAKKIFKLCREAGYKDSKDNWNPADFWIHNINISTILDNLKVDNITKFNDKMKEMFVKGDLVGVSLKKIEKGQVAKIDIVDPSNREVIDYNYLKTDYKNGSTNFIIKTKEGFNIRAGYKASSGSRKVYFEGRMAGTKVQLGAISKIQIVNIIKKKTGTDITSIENDETLDRDEIIKEIMELSIEVAKDKELLQDLYYLAMKQSKESSIYLKLH